MMTNYPYITDADMSIVVQGPVSKTPVPRKIGGQSHQLKGGVTHNVLEALRNLFPRAELILSTWEGTDTTGLIADKICLSPDPGFTMMNPIIKKLKFNLNRYVVSSQRGIQAATRPYTLKVRSDMLFVNDDFLAFWNEQKPTKRNPEFSVFKEFILNPAIYARKSVTPSKKTFPLYFHPSDWAHFGLTEDLNTLFDIPLFPEAELASYFLENAELRNEFEDPTPEYHFQFHPEQLVLMACLRKQGWQIPYEHRLEYKPELQGLSDQLMVNNFIFLNQSQWLYFSLKHLFMQHQLTSSQYHGLYDFATWQADYTRLVDSTYRPFETAEPSLRQDYFDAYFGIPLDYSLPLAHQLHPKNPTVNGGQQQQIALTPLKPSEMVYTPPTEKIPSNKISVVVQGAISAEHTQNTLQSIRQHLPAAELILSTWENSPVAGLDFDKLVQSVDPHAVICDDTTQLPNNVNRQIVSTKAGLAQATRPYVLKMRSDMLLKGTNFLTFYNRYPERCSPLKLLKERVLINNLYTAHPEKTDFLFHPSDWIAFGLKEDVQAIWDIPLAPEPETSRWFFDKERPASDSVPTWLFRYIPEQYIWISFLKKHLNVDFQHFSDCTPANRNLSMVSMVNNLVVLDYGTQFDVEFAKYDPYKHSMASQQTNFYWYNNYQKYCCVDAEYSESQLNSPSQPFEVTTLLPKQLTGHTSGC